MSKTTQNRSKDFDKSSSAHKNAIICTQVNENNWLSETYSSVSLTSHAQLSVTRHRLGYQWIASKRRDRRSAAQWMRPVQTLQRRPSLVSEQSTFSHQIQRLGSVPGSLCRCPSPSTAPPNVTRRSRSGPFGDQRPGGRLIGNIPQTAPSGLPTKTFCNRTAPGLHVQFRRYTRRFPRHAAHATIDCAPPCWPPGWPPQKGAISLAREIAQLLPLQHPMSDLLLCAPFFPHGRSI